MEPLKPISQTITSDRMMHLKIEILLLLDILKENTDPFNIFLLEILLPENEKEIFCYSGDFSQYVTLQMFKFIEYNFSLNQIWTFDKSAELWL